LARWDSKQALRVSPPVASAVDVVARIRAEVRRADDEELETVAAAVAPVATG
jgi:hypothetical protein